MKYKILAIFLSVIMCLGLIACGSEEPKETVSVEEAVSVSNNNLNHGSVVISVGKTAVNYNEFLSYYYLMKNQYENVLGTEIWAYKKALSGEKTLGQEAIESVLRHIIQIKVICKEAGLQKVLLSTDEKEQASHNAKVFCDSLADTVKSENGMDVKTVTRIFEENKLAQKMYNIQLGKVNANLTPEQIKAAKVQLIYWSANDKNREEVRKKAEQVYQSLSTAVGSFYTIAKENTEASEIETIIGASDIRTNLAKAVVALKKGQTTNVIAEKDGFYLAYCVEPDSKVIQDEYRNQVVLEKQTQAFQKTYKGWSDKFEVKVSRALLVEKK